IATSNKLCRFFLLFFLVVNLPLINASETFRLEEQVKSIETQKQVTTQHKQQPSFMARHSGVLLTILFAELLYGTADDATRASLLQQLRPESLLKNFALEYGAHVITTFAHELGHAAMAKYLNNNPIKIHLGSNSGGIEGPLLILPHVSIDGLIPTEGYAVYSLPYKNNQKILVKITELVAEYCKKNTITPSQLPEEEREQLLEKALLSPEGRAFTNSL